MLHSISLENLLFLDIETVSAQASLNDLSPLLQKLWLEKFTKIAPVSEDGKQGYPNHAGLYAEFGKIICISAGYFYHHEGQEKFRIKSFYGDQEALLLRDFLESLNQFSIKIPRLTLCGHNIREFDIPYICRRAMINRLTLPPLLHVQDKKPWEIMLLDTMHLWRFGDHRNHIPLKLMAGVLDIPSPKDDIDGAMVGETYWELHDLPRIVSYCQKDVLTVAQIIRRFKELPLLTDENLEIIP